jgi:hypothetical protein
MMDKQPDDRLSLSKKILPAWYEKHEKIEENEGTCFLP